jgi:aspartate/methionine/tyrosine aminotransferase
VAHLWRTETLDTAAVSASYAARRDGLLGALADRGVTAYGRSSMNVWIPVPEEAAAVAWLLRSGWAVAPGSRFRLSSPPGIRVTVSPLTTDDTPALAEAIAAAVRPYRVGRFA